LPEKEIVRLLMLCQLGSKWRGKFRLHKIIFCPSHSPTFNINTFTMAQTGTKAEQDLAALKSTVSTASTLISQLQSTVPAVDSSKNQNDANALDLAHDSASLIRAHTTKLSLLIINKPFTPTAISTVLRELVAGPIPGLASAIELCTAGKYTKAMSAELQYRGRKVFSDLGTLVQAIPLDGKILSDDAKNGTEKGKGKGSLAITGTVWEGCDGVMELKALGVAGLVIKKAEEYRDLLKDALEELQEWAEEESDGEDGEAVDGEEDPAQAEVDNLFGSQRHIPSDDPESIRPRLESSMKRLRLLILMYQAVVKRRFKTLPHLPHPELPPELKEKSDEDPGIVNCLDEVLDVMKKIPDITDELASAFYELDAEEIDKRMDQCFFTGFAAAELLIKNWEGQKDEFTTWVCSSVVYACEQS
jgi:Grap2 and cyclin-D-interacting